MIMLTDWTLRDFDPGAGLNQGAAAGDGEDWIPVSGPGDTYLALVEAGRLDHPYQGRGERPAEWVRNREWWWRCDFQAPSAPSGDRTLLTFEGLDTFASIYLDGALVGRTDNMFMEYEFDVTDQVRPGETHRLAICFDPATPTMLAASPPPWPAFSDRVSRSRRNQMRKAQFGWGWDWGPDLPTVGVWKPVRIETRASYRIAGVRFDTLFASAETARTQITIEAPAEDALTVEVTLAEPDGATVFHQRSPSGAASLDIDLQHPKLWWTADLGDQPLYTLTVRLLAADRLVDETRQQVGVRTVALDQSPDPDEPGATFFRFVLNGHPMFAKGACWVPTTSFVGDVASEPYERLIDQAVNANMNMIRVWGGGIYEPDAFYDLCDRKGLLVWQDFMFACAHYPEDDAFVALVEAEIEQQVRRLRNHACLAVWCGNNENQALHRINEDKEGVSSRLFGLRLYDEVMPAMLEHLDPAKTYRTSSPWGGTNPNSMLAGDVHDWTVWHGCPPIPEDQMIGEFRSDPEGVSYLRYAEDMSRFVSEFGLQGAPALATLKRWMDPDDLNLDNEGFLARIKDEARKADAMMEPVTGLPTTLQDYVDFTQWCQAEGLKFGIEHFRRRRPHCSGALLWQFNDCWPCISWSLVDYDGVTKASYHAVRRAFAPVLASFRRADDGQLELWISNDNARPIEGVAVLALQGLDGRERSRQDLAFSAPAGGHAIAWRGVAPQGDDCVLRVWSPDGAFEANRYLPEIIAKLTLVAGARPTVSVTRLSATALRIDLTAEVYLAFVHLVSDRADLTFSDNHFDLAAGEGRSVTVRALAPLGANDLSVRCWNDRGAG
ncbi:glycoside hydrolase family 2 protein [Brevundimonas sp. G8]|uniref:glycoside hydrolase family 2 protein n=1 Tax=Brevundimonas sp. G8 TaxID=1350776 RepID=UPI0012F0B9DE|nr:glycoside hydrolase family 2 protein [Brevundimonas sp. G8]VXB66111.1 Beta-mannosidase [Brevundimonas sp. G8]